MNHDNLTINDTSNEFELNGLKTISAGDLEINGKVTQETSEASEQKVMNGSTVVMVQHSNQNVTGEKKAQGNQHHGNVNRAFRRETNSVRSGNIV